MTTSLFAPVPQREYIYISHQKVFTIIYLISEAYWFLKTKQKNKNRTKNWKLHDHDFVIVSRQTVHLLF